MKKVIGLTVLLFMATGCGSFDLMGSSFSKPVVTAAGKAVYSSRFERSMQKMAKELSKKAKARGMKDAMVVVTNFNPVGEYKTSGKFGQILAERMLVELSEFKFHVYDMRKTKNIIIKDEKGFFSLSNKMKNLNSNIRADLVMVGSYALVANEVMISGMLIKADDGQVIASSTQNMNINENSFLLPLITPINSNAGLGSVASSRKGSSSKGVVAMREPLYDEDSSEKKLDIKIERLSHNIIRNMSRGGLSKVLVVSTYVNLDDMTRSNSFGRYVSEGLMQQLSMRGFRVLEVRATKELFITPRVGEMALSRDGMDLLEKYKADAILLGTYRKVGEMVKVHTRMIIAGSQEVISASSMNIEAKEGDKFMESLFTMELGRVSFGQPMLGDF